MRVVAGLRALAIVRDVEIVKTFETIYGKRIIIMGGGAQVGQVAIGAIPRPIATISAANIFRSTPFHW